MNPFRHFSWLVRRKRLKFGAHPPVPRLKPYRPHGRHRVDPGTAIAVAVIALAFLLAAAVHYLAH